MVLTIYTNPLFKPGLWCFIIKKWSVSWGGSRLWHHIWQPTLLPWGCHIVFYPNTFAIFRQKRRKGKKYTAKICILLGSVNATLWKMEPVEGEGGGQTEHFPSQYFYQERTRWRNISLFLIHDFPVKVEIVLELLTPLSWPTPPSGTAQWESAGPETCSRGSSCPPRRSPGSLGSLWATAARWGRAAAAAGGGRTEQEGSGGGAAAAAEAGPIDRGSAAAAAVDADAAAEVEGEAAAAAAAAPDAAAAAAAAPAGRGEPRLCCSPGADGGGPAPGDWRCGESGGGGGGGGGGGCAAASERAAGRTGEGPAAVGSPRSGPPPFARARRCAGAASGSGSAGSGRWWWAPSGKERLSLDYPAGSPSLTVAVAVCPAGVTSPSAGFSGAAKSRRRGLWTRCVTGMIWRPSDACTLCWGWVVSLSLSLSLSQKWCWCRRWGWGWGCGRGSASVCGGGAVVDQWCQHAGGKSVAGVHVGTCLIHSLCISQNKVFRPRSLLSSLTRLWMCPRLTQMSQNCRFRSQNCLSWEVENLKWSYNNCETLSDFLNFIKHSTFVSCTLFIPFVLLLLLLLLLLLFWRERQN